MAPDWNQLLDDFLADSAADWDKKTLLYHRARLRPFLAFLTRRHIREPAQITLRDIRRFFADLRQSGLSWSTRNGTHTSLSLFFRWLRRLRLIEHDLFNDPESDLKRPEKPRQVKELVPRSAIRAMVRAARIEGSRFARRDEAIMRLLFNTGVRRNELVKLNVHDFEPETRKLTIRRGGKKGHQRVVFVHRPTVHALFRWLEVRPQTDDPALFTTLRAHKGGRYTRMNPNRLNAIMIKWRDIARLPHWTKVNPHAWRHRFGTDWVAGAGDVFSLQALMGHSDVAITREYVHLNEELLRRKADLFGPGKDLDFGLDEGESV